jgi:hypothetical protein
MSATYSVQVTLTRTPDPNDVQGACGPRSYNLDLPGLVAQELSLKVPPAAVDLPLLVPGVGAPQVVFIRSDIPGITYKRNLETVANTLGAGGFRLEAGAPGAGSPTLTQLLFSNPGGAAAQIYVLVAGPG